jgi:hypothetical protein
MRNPFASMEERGDVLGAYVVVKTPDGAYLTTAMSMTEILDIRDRSEAWKKHAADPSKHGGPWQTDFGEMAKKTVIKRAAKLWSKVDRRLHSAIQHLNVENEEGLPAIENEVPGSDDTRNKRVLSRLDMPINRGGFGKERAKVIRATARECIDLFNEGDEIGAYGSAIGITDQDEKEALWACLARYPTLRSALKRMSKEEEAAEQKLRENQQALVDGAQTADAT